MKRRSPSPTHRTFDSHELHRSKPVKRPAPSRRVVPLLFGALAWFAALGCGSGSATNASGTSSGAGSVGCSRDSDCTAFSSSCCDCADSAAHNSEVRSLMPKCDTAQRCASTASCTNESRMAQCSAGKCVLRTAANLTLGSYDQSCSAAEDCVGVHTSFSCGSCGTAPFAINKNALPAFQKAYTDRFAGFTCGENAPDCEPSQKKPTCDNKVCKPAQ